ncbi:MAG: ribose-phosphate diphosphokinase [Candidatus Levyibacteriota bacterium]
MVAIHELGSSAIRPAFTEPIAGTPERPGQLGTDISIPFGNEYLALIRYKEHPLADAVGQILQAHVGNGYAGRFAKGRYAEERILVTPSLEQIRAGKTIFAFSPRKPNDLDSYYAMLDAITAVPVEDTTPGHVYAVLPYFSHSRQERREIVGAPARATLMANIMRLAGNRRLNGILTVDVHQPRPFEDIDIPFYNLDPWHVLQPALERRLRKMGVESNDVVFVSPDKGGEPRATAYAQRLGARGLVIFDKTRGDFTQTGVSHIVSERGNVDMVEGAHAVIVDDLIAGGGTAINAANKLLDDHKAASVTLVATHGTFASKEAIAALQASRISRIIITDTVKPPKGVFGHKSKFTVVSAAPLLAEAMTRMTEGISLTDLLVPKAA